MMNEQCAATKDMSPFAGFRRCPNRARYGEWCFSHAHSIGGWKLVSPEDAARLAYWRKAGKIPA